MRYWKTIYVEVEAESIEDADNRIHDAVSPILGQHGVTFVDEASDDTCLSDVQP